MPLTLSGKRILSKMKKQYREKGKGKEVFYAMIAEKKPGTSKWHGKK